MKKLNKEDYILYLKKLASFEMIEHTFSTFFGLQTMLIQHIINI